MNDGKMYFVLPVTGEQNVSSAIAEALSRRYPIMQVGGETRLTWEMLQKRFEGNQVYGTWRFIAGSDVYTQALVEIVLYDSMVAAAKRVWEYRTFEGVNLTILHISTSPNSVFTDAFETLLKSIKQEAELNGVW